MMNSLNVVVAQSPSGLLGPSQRFDWLKDHLEKGAAQEADILVLPELFLTGYNIGAKACEWCEPSDGPYAQRIAGLCQEHSIAIHYGYAEKEGDLIYNASQCFGADGMLLTYHRKLILPPGFEADYFTAGKSYTTFTLKNFKIGTLICYDAEFPENFRAAASQGVDLVLVPTALGAQWGVVAQKVIPTRAFENGVFVCYANHTGHENGTDYLGESCIVSPIGQDISRAGHDAGFITATLKREDVKAAQERLPYLQDIQRLPH